MTLLGEAGRGCFPYARSEHATKHLRALVAGRMEGKRAALVFCVLHSGIWFASIADWIDPGCSTAVLAAESHRVEICAYSTRIMLEDVWLENRLPFAV